LHFAEQIIQLRLAARAADAAHGIGDDAGGLDKPGLEQRDDRSKTLVG